MAKILISDPIHEDALSQLMQSSHEIFDHSENKDGFERILPIVDGIIIRTNGIMSSPVHTTTTQH